MNMKRNKESGEEEGGGGEISTDAGSQASNPCFGARRSLAAGVIRWSLYFTMVSALPALPRLGAGAVGSQPQDRTWSRREHLSSVFPMLSWRKIEFVPIVKVET